MYKNIILDKSIFLIEKKYSVWDYKYFGYPIYFSIRPHLLKDHKYLRKKITFSNFIKKLLNDLTLLRKSYKNLCLYKVACFSSERGINLENIFEKNTERVIFFISDQNTNSANNENFNNIYLSDSLINLTRLVIYFFNFFLLPIYTVSNLGVASNFQKILSHNFPISYIKTLIILNKALSDINFCIFLKFIFNKVVVSGGACPNVITYFFEYDSCEVYEIQHGYIGKGHQLYAEIVPLQVNLVLNMPISENITNRVTLNFSEILYTNDYIYKFDKYGHYVYFGSPFDYYSGIKSKSLKKRYIYKPHPTLKNKYPNHSEIKNIRYALIEPSTLIIVFIELKIPFSIICFKEDIVSIKSYFNIKDPTQVYLDPRAIGEDFLVANTI